ncbi:MAG TPA: tetratricopeptide repeat protein [Longimicrobium sp.]|uniref:tetratricopeptide repeat protein n=1 Tax=Longimicrobium sp. TaxID=2029185 RepID=UPI002ED85D79
MLPSPSIVPLSARELEDLRWYLEDYLQAPFAVYEERGSAIQGRIGEWGTRLFEALFGRGKPGRDAYLRARSSIYGWSLWIASDSPAFLSLPWELMRDPSDATPLALEVPVSRTTDMVSAALSASGEELRVLMVIARPAGVRNADYRAIARPLVARLPGVSGRVTVDVARPPTLNELRRRMQEARQEGRPYQVVHFDGHGTYQARGRKPRGYLLFENEGGDKDPIPAEDFGAVLAGAGVPLLVLNACQSGTLTNAGAVEAAVATRVLRAGAAAVVAMGYSIYVAAAAEFMAAFYESLFNGESVEEAMRSGRRRMHRAALRHSPRGPMPLDDWMVPVHYARSAVRFPCLAPRIPSPPPSPDAPMPETQPGTAAQTTGTGDREGVLDAANGVFVGRDREFLRLERALRHRRVLVLHGQGGTGKTELAKGFARWLRDTGGVDAIPRPLPEADPRLVFFHSFEPGVASFGLSGVVTSIGIELFGADFVRDAPNTAEHTSAILDLMRRKRILLVWDNFETVRSMPDPTGTTPPLDPAEQDEIQEFLAEVAKGANSGVIITSRTPEAWLGGVERLEVPALDSQDAVEYANVLLAPYPAAQPRREERAFGELLETLGGNPLGMRLTLPHLARSGAPELLRQLREAAPLDPPDGRLDSLAACVSYSFRHLPDGDRRLLPALALFEGMCDTDVLRVMSEQPDSPHRFHGIVREVWDAMLDRCVAVGLLTGVEDGMYRIHPALPSFLEGLWREQAGSDYDSERAEALRAAVHGCAELGEWAVSQIEGGDAGFAFSWVQGLRRTLGGMAVSAVGSGDFIEAYGILRPLVKILEAEGGWVELRGWADYCRKAVEGPLGEAPEPGSAARALWILVLTADAGIALLERDAARAESALRRIESVLRDSRNDAGRFSLAAIHHRLGIAAQLQGDLAAAEEWYRRSMAVMEELGNRSSVADSCHQLGVVAQLRSDLPAAEEWAHKALEIRGALEDQPGRASVFHQLAGIAKDRGDFSAAEEWYHRSLAIEEELGNRHGTASSFHQLGIVAQRRGNLVMAEEWARRSLLIWEELGSRAGVAHSFHQLGIVAQLGGDPSAAEQWYRKALPIMEELGIGTGMASSCFQLGRLAQDRGDPGAAEEWYHRSLAITDRIGDRSGVATAYQQLGMVAQERGDLATAEEWYGRSLTIRETLERLPELALSYGQMGLLEEQKNDLHTALEWMVRANTLFPDFGNQATGPAPYHLARFTRALGMPTLEAAWRRLTSTPLPMEAREAVLWMIDQLERLEANNA